MKISLLDIDEFAIEDYPTFTKKDIAGKDLLVKGSNRSGKTLTLNAILYGLYGPRSTFGVQPGRSSDVEIRFNNGDRLYRGGGGGGREYRHDGSEYETDEVDEIIPSVIGPENIVNNQFIHSETDKLPLSTHSKDDLLATIRRITDSEIQHQIAELQEERKDLKQEIEQIERRELRPKQRELEELAVNQLEHRLGKLEELQSLIDSGRIHDIKDSLLEDKQVNKQLDEKYKRKREIEQELRKVNRRLREAHRYTDDVNTLILEAIDELTCPVCDHVVEEQIAEQRLDRGKCPQCGRNRDLSDLKSNLGQKVDKADETIEEGEEEKEALQDEKERIVEEIDSLQSSNSNLEELNDLTKLTLRNHNYDISAVAEETQRKLEQQREAIEEEKTTKEQLMAEIEAIESERDGRIQTLYETEDRITELTEESFEVMISEFQNKWSDIYQLIAGDFGLEIHIEEDGEILLPGNEGPREYAELSTGEARLLNLAFAYTTVDAARENDEFSESLETVILDEPFANLDEEKRDNAMHFIREVDTQAILFSSNEELEDYFEGRNVEELETLHIQMTFDDYHD